ncbi:MAG: divergent PAP2 family protein [Candidatus Falkowbacteria bacterium]
MSPFIIVPLTAAIIAQVTKFFIKSNGTHFSWRALIAYSGMPSSHAAVTVSLATIIGLEQGWQTATFALAGIFALITIRDAVGLRRQVGRQGAMINELTRELDEERLLSEKFPNLLEKVGHTPAQLAVGSLIGLAVAIIIHLVF